MSKSLYSDARLYDLLFPPPADLGAKATFYLDLADSTGGGPVLELACGTGTILLPIAARGIPCEGIDLSEEMLAVARAKSQASGVNVGLRTGDMAKFELPRQFPLIFSASNSLLHLHATSDLLSCFGSVRRHLQPGGRFAFDVFNPSVRMLASADGVRREMQRFIDPERGEVRLDAAKRTTPKLRSAERSGTSLRRANRTSSSCRSSCAASSLRSCRCFSTLVVFGSWSGTATSRESRSPQSRLTRCAYAKPSRVRREGRLSDGAGSRGSACDRCGDVDRLDA